VTPRQELDTFLAKFDPEVVRVARAALKRLQRQFPGAIQLVYDNYNALAIGFAPEHRPSSALVSIALYPRWVTLFFLKGAFLKDPHKRLAGSGKIVRSIRLDGPEVLDDPEVQELLDVATQGSGMKTGKGKLVIQSVSKVQRSRRPRP
jgi:hypothetical protein